MSIAIVFHQGLQTGGPEALHQLFDSLNTLGVPSALVPHPETVQNAPVDGYEKYGPRYAQFKDLDEQDYVLVPEIYPDILLSGTAQRGGIWWLSVDNSPAFYSFMGWVRGRHGRRSVANLLRVPIRQVRAWRLRSQLRRHEAIDHYFQSAYAREVVNKSLKKTGPMLSDYISHGRQTNGVRQAKVAYNPSKLTSTSRRIIRIVEKQVGSVPIKNMTSEQVSEALSSCSVYFEGGHHPGRDRLPREARLLGCVVIASSLGAGRRFDDLPLPAQYKFPTHAAARKVAGHVVECVLSSEHHLSRQSEFLKRILDEKRRFDDEVRLAFGRYPRRTAIRQVGPDEDDE